MSNRPFIVHLYVYHKKYFYIVQHYMYIQAPSGSWRPNSLSLFLWMLHINIYRDSSIVAGGGRRPEGGGSRRRGGSKRRRRGGGGPAPPTSGARYGPETPERVSPSQVLAPCRHANSSFTCQREGNELCCLSRVL